MLQANSRLSVRTKVQTKLAVLPGSTQTPPSCAISAIEWPAWPPFFICSSIAFMTLRCSACSAIVPMVSSCGSMPSLRMMKRTVSPSRTSSAFSEKALSVATTSMVRVALAGSPGRPPLGFGPCASAGATMADARTPTNERRNNMKLLLESVNELNDFSSDAWRRRILRDGAADAAGCALRCRHLEDDQTVDAGHCRQQGGHGGHQGTTIACGVLGRPLVRTRTGWLGVIGALDGCNLMSRHHRM